MAGVVPRNQVCLVEIAERKGSMGSNGSRSVGKRTMRMDSALQPGSNLPSCKPKRFVVFPNGQDGRIE